MSTEKPSFVRRAFIGSIGAIGLATVGGIIGRGVGGLAQKGVDVITSASPEQRSRVETPITITATAVGAGLGIAALVKSTIDESHPKP